MKNLALFFAILLTLSAKIFAQGVGINTTGDAADNSAMLDVSSTTKGFLPPRMNEAQKNAISSPATGLLVYQTDGTAGLYYYNGSSWVTFVTGTHYIGESYDGGIVFFVDATGQHGLIAATSDQSTSAGMRWYAGSNTNTMARGDGIGAGARNTAIIIANQGNGEGTNTSGFSALLAGYRSNNVSYDQFYNLYSFGGFWSSTNSSLTTAHLLILGDDFSFVYMDTFDINYGVSVRCIKD